MTLNQQNLADFINLDSYTKLTESAGYDEQKIEIANSIYNPPSTETEYHHSNPQSKQEKNAINKNVLIQLLEVNPNSTKQKDNKYKKILQIIDLFNNFEYNDISPRKNLATPTIDLLLKKDDQGQSALGLIFKKQKEESYNYLSIINNINITKKDLAVGKKLSTIINEICDSNPQVFVTNNNGTTLSLKKNAVSNLSSKINNRDPQISIAEAIVKAEIIESLEQDKTKILDQYDKTPAQNAVTLYQKQLKYHETKELLNNYKIAKPTETSALTNNQKWLEQKTIATSKEKNFENIRPLHFYLKSHLIS